MLLYPRLLISEASAVAAERATLSLKEARAASDTGHPASAFGPTGGSRIDSEGLARLQSAVREVASKNGYPDNLNLERQQRFDADAATILKTRMRISAAEASHTGVWSFLACILLPDIVRWRYPGGEKGTTLERFLGGSRGLRNALGRLWWRGHLLGFDGDFTLLQELGEDELVQITERPVLAGNPDVARLFARRFLDYSGALDELSRSDLMRDAIKRLRRLMSFLALDVLSPDQLLEVVDQVLGDAAIALGTAETRLADVPQSTAHDERATPEPNETTPSDAGARLANRLQIPPATLEELIRELEAVDLEVIDKRDASGCLWVVDEPGLEAAMERLNQNGFPFLLAATGGRSTDHRRAWYLPHDFERDGHPPRESTEEGTGSSPEEEEMGGGEEEEDIERLRHLELWEQGVFDDTDLRPDFRVNLDGDAVKVSPQDSSGRSVTWRLYETSDELRDGLRDLLRIGPDTALLAIVAATFVHQQEFLEAGRTALYGLTLNDIGEYLSTHESTISRAKSDVYVETPDGLLPLEYFFSAGVPHASGRDISARSVRVVLRHIIEAEPSESPFTDDELRARLVGRGFEIARRTVAKYRDVLGIPGAPVRKRQGEDAAT